MKKFLLGVLLIILIGLLLLPPGLRWFANDLFKEKVEKKDVVTIVNCQKGEDTINTTYFNDTPYDFRYIVKGNYTLENENTGNSENLETTNNFDNSIIYDIRSSSMVNYSEDSDTTTFHILLSSVEMINEKLRNYTKLPEEQQKYYTSMGFQCTMSKV